MKTPKQSKYPELYSDEFVDFCLKNIVPLCQEDNRTKKKEKKYNAKQDIIIIAIILVIILCIMIFESIAILTLFFFITAFALIFFLYHSVLNYNSKNQIYTQKQNIYPLLFSFYNGDCEYLNTLDDYYRIKSNIEGLELYYTGTNYTIGEIDDIFKLKYKGLNLEMCEFFMTKSSEDEEYTKNNAIKYGSNIFFKIKRKNQSEEKTIITRQKELTILDYKKDIVKLESTDFNRKFNVYSTSQFEARKILTPLFMEKLNDFCYLEFVSSINIFIDKSSINIIISHKKNNLFEASYLFRNEKNRLLINLRKILIEHREILSLLDELGIEHLSKI